MQRSVAGWLERDGSVLLGLRSDTGSQADRWELPGGKVDPGESDPQALIREFREECELAVTVGEALASARFTHRGVHHEVRAYRLSASGLPTKGRDHWTVSFIPLSAVLSLPLVPSDRRLIRQILRRSQMSNDE